MKIIISLTVCLICFIHSFGQTGTWNGTNIPTRTSNDVTIGTVSIPNPTSNLHILGPKGLLFTTRNPPNLPIPANGAGIRMMWYPSYRAFRAGQVTANQWDQLNTGFYSTAFGYNTTASGTASFSVGLENSANQTGAVAIGLYNIAHSYASGVLSGSFNKVYNNYSVISGGDNNAIYSVHSAIGGGRLNKINANEGFIGGGSSNEINNSNAVISGGSLNEVNGKYSFIGGGSENKVETNYTTISGGYRNFADADYSTVLGGLDNQSIGIGALSGGRGANASGNDAIAIGQGQVANNIYGVSIGGHGNNAVDDYSAIYGGARNFANGISSSILNSQISRADGNNSIILGGIAAHTIGRLSTTINGDKLIAQTPFATYAGRFNEQFNNVDPDLWIDTTELFVVANGTGIPGNFDERRNALTLLKDGRLGVGPSGSPFQTTTLHIKSQQPATTVGGPGYEALRVEHILPASPNDDALLAIDPNLGVVRYISLDSLPCNCDSLNANATSDADWYEVGLGTSPDNITDDQYTFGRNGIDADQPTAKLQIGRNVTPTDFAAQFQQNESFLIIDNLNRNPGTTGPAFGASSMMDLDVVTDPNFYGAAQVRAIDVNASSGFSGFAAEYEEVNFSAVGSPANQGLTMSERIWNFDGLGAGSQAIIGMSRQNNIRNSTFDESVAYYLQNRIENSTITNNSVTNGYFNIYVDDNSNFSASGINELVGIENEVSSAASGLTHLYGQNTDVGISGPIPTVERIVGHRINFSSGGSSLSGSGDNIGLEIDMSANSVFNQALRPPNSYGTEMKHISGSHRAIGLKVDRLEADTTWGIFVNDTVYNYLKGSLGVGIRYPEHSIHINSIDPGIDDPLRVQDLLPAQPNDNSVLVTDPSIGIVRYLSLDSLLSITSAADGDWNVTSNGTSLEAIPGSNSVTGANCLGAGLLNNVSGFENMIVGTTSSINGGTRNGIFAGSGNLIQQASHSAIVGGYYHEIRNFCGSNLLGGGYGNTIEHNSSLGTVNGQALFNAMIGGNYNRFYGGHNSVIAGGNHNRNKAYNSFTSGMELSNRSYNQTLLGRYNDTSMVMINHFDAWSPGDGLFIVGNGNGIPNSPMNRSNALTLLKDGRLGLGTSGDLDQTTTLHIRSQQPASTIGGIGHEPLKIENMLRTDTLAAVLVIDPTDGVVRYLEIDSLPCNCSTNLNRVDNSALSEIEEMKKELEDLKDQMTSQHELIQSQQVINDLLLQQLNGMNAWKSNVDSILGLCCGNFGIKMKEDGLPDLPYLDQNIPNPFSKNTVINYYLPEQVNSAFIRISDELGKEYRKYENLNRGKSFISINNQDFSQGIYFYELVVDGKLVDTKKMIVAY